MKNSLIILITVFLLVSGTANAALIEEIELQWGSNSTLGTFNPGLDWDTKNDTGWILGVKNTLNGNFFNDTDTQFNGTPNPFYSQLYPSISAGDYYLFAEPDTTRGYSNARLEVTWDDGTILASVFEIDRDNTWTLLDGSNLLSLGWADKTGLTEDDQISPFYFAENGQKDWVFEMNAATPVPIPQTLWLLSAGLVGLVGLRKAKQTL